MSDERRNLDNETPPGGGRLDHDAMRAAAMRPMAGPDRGEMLAAGGGLELPGREAHAMPVETVTPVPEPIPGERDAATLTWRQPGAMGGRSSGADTPPPDPSTWMDGRTARDHAFEGGGGEQPPARRGRDGAAVRRE